MKPTTQQLEEANELLKQVFNACNDHLADFSPSLYSRIQKYFNYTVS